MASNLIGLIGWKDLRMTLEETEGIARLHAKKKMSVETVRYLHHKSDGWVAGLVLLLTKTDKENLEPQNSSRHAPEEIFDYFAREIYDRLGTRMRGFLIRTAFCPTFSVKMAQQLTGRGNAARILATMTRLHYFTEMYPDADARFRYHSLFREFLLSRGKKEFSRAELSRIRGAASAVLEESGQVEDAASLRREDKDWEGVVRMIQDHAPTLVAQGRGQTLRDWLEYLPKEILERTPWCVYWMGVCRLPITPEKSRVLFEKAFHRFREQRDIPGAFIAWSGVVDAILYGFENFQLLDLWYSTFTTLWEENGEFPSTEIAARVTCSMIKALSFRCSPSFDAARWAERALGLAQTTPAMPIKIEIYKNLLWHNTVQGAFEKAEITLHSLNELLKQEDVPPLLRLEAALAEAEYCNTIGLYDRSREVADRALAFADKNGVHLMDYLLLGEATFSLLNQGDLAAGKQSLRRMGARLGRAKPWEAALYHYLRAWKALFRREEKSASFHSAECLRLLEGAGSYYSLHKAHILEAFVRQEFQDTEGAKKHLEKARRIPGHEHNPHDRFTCLLTEAYFLLSERQDAAALEKLREGMRIGRRYGFFALFLWRPGLLEKLASRALAGKIEVDYVKELIRHRNLLPDDPFLEADNWPWPVEVYTLGRFGIVLEGKKFAAPRKAQLKPVQMLKALIALGGRNVSEERLSVFLWPDADGDQAHQSFATTLRRLRKLLGNEKALLFSDGYLTLSNRYCWVDVWAFERVLGKFERTMEEGKHEAVEAHCAQLSEKAIALYQGPFLPGDTFCSDIDSHRERLRSKFLRCVKAAGRPLESGGQWGKALVCYQKGLEVDDLAEELYRRLMVCHRQLGQVAEALAVYHRCRRKLSAVLRVNPSPETEAVFRSLRKI
jgi:DNA-binding SARP family transcriptional activator